MHVNDSGKSSDLKEKKQSIFGVVIREEQSDVGVIIMNDQMADREIGRESS